MKINDVINIVRRVHDAEGVNLGTGTTRDARNRFWSRAIGIVHHGHPVYNPTPDPQWHLKSGGGGRPQSDDVVVSMPSREYWDCIPNAGKDGYSFRATGHGRLGTEQPVYAPPKPHDAGEPQPIPEPQPNPEPPPQSGGPSVVRGRLAPGQRLTPSAELRSANRAFMLVYQDDGNLVLYQRWDGTPIWASQTAGRSVGYAEMQGDGNFCLYDGDGKAIWDTAHGNHAPHGHDLVPGSTLDLQDDGNMLVHTPEGQPIWHTATPREGIPDMPGEPGDSGGVSEGGGSRGDIVPLHVQGDRRWLNVDLIGATAFGLAGRIRTQGWDGGKRFMDQVIDEGINCLHVITSLGPGYFSPVEIGPQHEGSSLEALDRQIDYAAGRGCYTQLIIVGGLDVFGAKTAARDDEYRGDIRNRVLDWAFKLVHRYAGRPEVLWNFWNEPEETGAKDSFRQLVEDGARLKAESGGQLWTFGSPGPNAGGNSRTLLTTRADLHSTHLNRQETLPGVRESWVTIKRSGEDASIDQELVPYWHDEDWNRGEGPTFYHRPARGDFDLSTAAAFCAGAHARARQHLISFHSDGGLFADELGPQTMECLRAFMRGLRAVPRLVGDKWRGHHERSFLRSAPYAPKDDVDIVKRHVDSGKVWRVSGTHDHAVSVCEHRDFDMRRHGGSETIDQITYHGYKSGVYTR